MIEFQNVTRTLGRRSVLHRFSLSVEKGERLVICGPSGSGKSTVLRLIAGFLAPDEGAILVGGRLASHSRRILIPPEERDIGFVFQDLALWPHMTVSQNIEFPLAVRNVPQPERRRRVEEALASVGLSSFAASDPTTLSGGQQQRVAIARAVISRPRVVLMDEPLANLDEELQAVLQQQILALHARFAFTLVYVTHSRVERSLLGMRSIDLEMA